MAGDAVSGLVESGSKERHEAGKALRKEVPRSSHGDWAPSDDRPDPISLLEAQDEGRLKHLIPIKYGRMGASPFAFLRGSAAVMAADLAETPVCGSNAELSGDAHLLNFGVFATPERKLVFDLNDFDESYRGPWEWDVKRLAASAAVVGRENGLKNKEIRKIAGSVAMVYREAMERFSRTSFLDTWYFQIEAERLLLLVERYSKQRSEKARRRLNKIRGKTQEDTVQKLTEVVKGSRRFISNPPLLVRFDDLLDEEQKGLALRHRVIEKAWSDYLISMPEERRLLLERFRVADVALRVGGTGSVGTRCGIVLLEGGTQADAIVLQLKEAGPSVLEPYLPKHGYGNPAHRVVISQRLLQAASDIFLGWHESAISRRYFYWRQLKDMKGSVRLAAMDEPDLRTYLRVCSECLSRAHARTGDPAVISGYLGKSDSFDVAIGEFAMAYADQTERDYQALVNSIKSGRIKAAEGI